MWFRFVFFVLYSKSILNHIIYDLNLIILDDNLRDLSGKPTGQTDRQKDRRTMDKLMNDLVIKQIIQCIKCGCDLRPKWLHFYFGDKPSLPGKQTEIDRRIDGEQKDVRTNSSKFKIPLLFISNFLYYQIHIFYLFPKRSHFCFGNRHLIYVLSR